MYQYDPQSPKKQEKALVFGSFFLAISFFAFSKIPDILFPTLYQLVAVFLLIGSVLIVTRCLLRRFIYCVDVRDNGDLSTALDFTVTEYYGNHVSVVCRISVSDIEEIIPVTKKNRKELSEMLRQKRVYYYTARLFSDNVYLLAVRDEDEIIYIRILADAALISALQQ